jgi:outer membrane murein-binding lipoprotein Lpp
VKLLGKDISAQQLLEKISERLSARGLADLTDGPIPMDGAEPRVDPLAFNLEALAEHADPTRALPLETHRGGVGGRAVVFAKWAFRRSCQIFINEALARQQVFNGHARDSYAQLSAEVKRLRSRLEALEQPRPQVAEKAKSPPRAAAVKKARPAKKR